MVWWMKYQIFAPILLLQFLNLFWYYLILRVAVRYAALSRNECAFADPCPSSAVTDVKATDVRSDDEDDNEPETADKED